MGISVTTGATQWLLEDIEKMIKQRKVLNYFLYFPFECLHFIQYIGHTHFHSEESLNEQEFAAVAN